MVGRSVPTCWQKALGFACQVLPPCAQGGLAALAVWGGAGRGCTAVQAGPCQAPLPAPATPLDWGQDPHDASGGLSSAVPFGVYGKAAFVPGCVL